MAYVDLNPVRAGASEGDVVEQLIFWLGPRLSQGHGLPTRESQFIRFLHL